MFNRHRFIIVMVFSMLSQNVMATGYPVYDYANHLESLKQSWIDVKTNVLAAKQVYYEIQSVENQIRMLGNQAQTLQDQAKHLQNLDFNSLDVFFEGFDQLIGVVEGTDSLLKGPSKIKDDFEQIYPNFVINSTTPEEARILKIMKKYRDDLAKAYGAVGLKYTVKDDKTLLKKYMNDAKTAKGELQINQAQAEIDGIMVKQLSEIKVLTASLIQASAARTSYLGQERLRRMKLHKELMKDLATQQRKYGGVNSLPNFK